MFDFLHLILSAEKEYFVLVITHDFELIESACDRCLRLENNQIYDL